MRTSLALAIASISSGFAKRVMYPLKAPAALGTLVANAAVRHGGENESRILDTVFKESASVSVAQNDFSLAEALCSSTASTGDCD